MSEKSVFTKLWVLKWCYNRSQSPVFCLAVSHPTRSEIWRFWYIKTWGREIAIKKNFAIHWGDLIEQIKKNCHIHFQGWWMDPTGIILKFPITMSNQVCIAVLHLSQVLTVQFSQSQVFRHDASDSQIFPFITPKIILSCT